MSQSYLERAKQWIDSAENVDIELLETTINRFQLELENISSQAPMPTSKIDDLSTTIKFLQDELTVLLGDEVFNKNTINNQPQQIKSELPQESDNYVYDPSPLTDLEMSIEKISAEQRKTRLTAIKNTSGILSAGELLKKSRPK